MTEIEYIIKEIKKSKTKLYITTSVNLIFGLSLLILFFTSFTEFGIFGNLPIPLKLVWLMAASINFYSVSKTIPIIKRSKELESKTEELQELLQLEGIC